MTSATVKAAVKFRKGLLDYLCNYFRSPGVFGMLFFARKESAASLQSVGSLSRTASRPAGRQGGFLIQNTEEELRKEILVEWS